MRAAINGKHNRSEPYYSLKEFSCAAEIPIFDGRNADIVFNWGGSFPHRPGSKVKVLNERPIFDKYSQSCAMLRKGVRTPNSWREFPGKYPVVEKPTVTHGGIGIRLLRKGDRPRGRGHWYQEFIDKRREYRAYFFAGEVRMVCEKIVKDKSKVIWNMVNCVAWERNHQAEANKELRELVIKSAEAIRLDWGCADIMEDKQGKLWICELNSRPSAWHPGRPKLKFRKDEKGIYRLVNGNRDDLSLSARLWGNCMQRYLRRIQQDEKPQRPVDIRGRAKGPVQKARRNNHSHR